jgi:hypothetical protein
MNSYQKLLAKFMVLVSAFALCGLPELCQAQQPAPQNRQQSGTSIDPSAGPLQPIPTPQERDAQGPAQPAPQDSRAALPNAPSSQYAQDQPAQQPVGTAAAEGVPTVGGAASRPAGEAIAPAKQNQRRSLLIKVGLIAAAGVAAGTVYGLSKASPSKPPTK